MKKIGRIFAGISAMLFCGGLSTFLSHGISLLNTPKTAEISGVSQPGGGGAEPLIDPGSGSSPQTNPEIAPGIIQVDFIQSSGSQYIDTGVQSSDDVGFKCNFEMINLLNTVLIGSKGSGNSRLALHTKDQIMLSWNSIGYIEDSRLGYEYEALLNYKNDRKRIVNGVFDSNVYATLGADNTYNLCVFGAYYGSPSATLMGSYKLYSCEITKGTNVVRNYVPCYNKNLEEYGLYDLVTEAFYGNSGTGKLYGKSFLEEGEEYKIFDYEQYFVDHEMTGDISTTTITGAGTDDDPYIINSSEDFWWMSKFLDLDNKNVELGCDVVLNEEKFDEDGNVIAGTSQDGRAYIWYSGRKGSSSMVFDGKGHTIYGLYIHNFNYEYARLGLFTWVKEFKNVNGSDFYLYSTSYVGGFVSDAELIENCHQLNGFMRVTGTCVGAIAYSASIVRNCTNRMKIVSENGGAGPVAGIVYGKYPWKTADLIENCINYADINSYYGSGIGQAKIIKNCVNYGNISGSNYCGGMTGRAEGFTFIDCKNYGTIETSDLGAGGMIGLVVSNLRNPIQFIGCESYGEIIAKGRGYGGLFVGFGRASMIFKNCKAESKGSGKYYCDFDNTYKWVIENCEQTITEYKGNENIFPSTSLEIRNFKLIVKSSSIASKNFYLADHKQHFNAKNMLIESDFNFTTKLFSNNNDQSALCMENIIIKTPTQKWYYGSNFSGFSISWRTGEINLNSMSSVGAFSPRLTEENLLGMGFEKKTI